MSTVCGKTGTAQVMSNDLVKALGGKESRRTTSWFVGFAPCENPEIVVVAFFEHGGTGADSAPIVRDVLKAYFDKKARVAQLALERREQSIAPPSPSASSGHWSSNEQPYPALLWRGRPRPHESPGPVPIFAKSAF